MHPLVKRIQEQTQNYWQRVHEIVAGWHLQYRARNLWHLSSPFLCLGLAWFIPRLWVDDPEAHMRWMGTLLQIAGVSTVAFGLKRTRELFGEPPVWESLVKSVKRVVRGPDIVSFSGSVILPGPLVHGHLTSSPQLSSDASLEDRINALEEQHEELQRRFHELRGHVDDRTQEIENQLSEEQTVREKADKQINQRIKEASIGGLYIELVGLIWLVIGILCASLPGEMALLLSW